METVSRRGLPRRVYPEPLSFFATLRMMEEEGGITMIEKGTRNDGMGSY
jgi:hypothetical protein